MNKTMTPAEREAIIAEIKYYLVRLGACEPRNDEERRIVAKRREQVGAERFDHDAESVIEFAHCLAEAEISARA